MLLIPRPTILRWVLPARAVWMKVPLHCGIAEGERYSCSDLAVLPARLAGLRSMREVQVGRFGNQCSRACSQLGGRPATWGSHTTSPRSRA